ncbi:MAG TPA: ribosome biogenesis GTPase Der [Chloroflexota bacterium]|nr:ribosome biogenesis GTPase Der [Chloroflexota bacterium]
MSKSIVAIVGRPNVGKSTLFNRLVGAPVAITESIPGTTRDRLYGDTDWNRREFVVVDTAGLTPGADEGLARAIRDNVEVAMDQADAILFLVDAKEGLVADDLVIAEMLRRTAKPVILAANKADSARRRLAATEFYELGLGEPIPISSTQGLGTGDMLDALVAHLPVVEEPAEERDAALRLAIVGRPNVGKSALLNALLGFERVLVSEVPGTTRDATDTLLEHEGQKIVLVDTAGIRRPGHIKGAIEKYSVMRAIRAIARADVALLVVDATAPLTAQDQHIAGYVREAGKGMIVVVNKWDLVEKTPTTMNEYTALAARELNFMPYVPVLFVSARTKQRVHKIVAEALRIEDERKKRIPTAQLNATVQAALREHPPLSSKGKLLKIKYVTQATTDPPTFVFFVNDPELVHFSYERFLENRLRAAFGFEGTAVRLVFRSTRANAKQSEGAAPRRLRA